MSGMLVISSSFCFFKSGSSPYLPTIMKNAIHSTSCSSLLRFPLITTAILGTMVSLSPKASATTFKVTNNNDSGPGSLRQAIIDAIATPELDTIDLTGVSGTIVLNSTAVLHTGNDIHFKDDGNTTISGQDRVQIITVNGANVTFTGLTFANGLAKGGDGSLGGGGGLGAGGALFINAGSATLNNVTFLRNKAQGGNGGNPHPDGNGGSYNSRGFAGGTGGGLNGLVGGTGGTGGARPAGWPFVCETIFRRCSLDRLNGGNGAPGESPEKLGAGGGAGGGSGGGLTRTQRPSGSGGDEGRSGNGGKGGNGAFGAGGGAGGGVGSIRLGIGKRGSGGAYGTGGEFGGNGSSGGTSDNRRIGGRGGGGAGLGGAIFVNSGASLTLSNATFRDNSAVGGIGRNNGSGIGKHIFVRDGGQFFYKGSSDNDLLSLDPRSETNEIYYNASYTVEGLDGQDKLYSIAGIGGITKTLIGGNDGDMFILNLRGNVKLAFNFNTQKLADFTNAVAIDPSSSENGEAGSELIPNIIADSLALLPISPVVTWIFSSGRRIGDYLDSNGSAQSVIEAQRQRAQNAISDFGTRNWGEIFQEGTRDLIVIEDFQPGLDTLILPSLPDSTTGTYEYTLNLGFSNEHGGGIEINVRKNNNDIERFVFLKISIRILDSMIQTFLN